MSDFKHGDRVTSPLLVGEWLIYGTMRGNLPPDWVWLIRADEKTGDVIPEYEGRLTLVAPPLPPEPPTGSVVFVDGEGFVNRTRLLNELADEWDRWGQNDAGWGDWLRAKAEEES